MNEKALDATRTLSMAADHNMPASGRGYLEIVRVLADKAHRFMANRMLLPGSYLRRRRAWEAVVKDPSSV